MKNKKINERIVDPRYGSSIVKFDVIVPMDYNHMTFIDEEKGRVKKRKNTSSYNNDLNSRNFEKATTKLVSGKIYTVKIFPILGIVTSEDNLNFLKKQKAIFVGAQGLMLAQSQHKNKFPKGKWIVSFDEKEALWQDCSGYYRVPYIFSNSNGCFNFELIYFGSGLNNIDCLICFEK